MKIWLIQRAEPTPHDGNGNERRLRTGLMAEFFAAAGHDATWFTSTFDHYRRIQRFPRTTSQKTATGFDIQYLHAPAYARNISLARLRNERMLAREFRRAADTLAQPDLIICSLPSIAMARAAMDYARAKDVPLVCDVRDLWPDVFLDVLPAFARPIASPLLKNMRAQLGKVVTGARLVTGLTDEYIDWAIQYADRPRGPDDIPLPMAYMPTDDIRLTPEEIETMGRKFQCSDGELEVLFIGTIGPMMDLHPVIKAARAIHDRGHRIRFRICGAGSELEKLVEQARDLSNVNFPGWINAREINFLLSRSHVGLLPYADLDTFRWSLPNKFGEYLSGRIPLAANLNESAMGRLVESSAAGFTYDNAASQLSHKLIALAENPASLETLRDNARRLYLSDFHGPTVYASFIEQMERVAAMQNAV